MTDKNIERFDLAENEANVETSGNVKKKGQDIRINKCNQCKYTSSNKGHLRTHLKMHSGEKCDYASYRASNLMKHLKTNSGEK